MPPDDKPYRVYRSRRGGLRLPRISRSGPARPKPPTPAGPARKAPTRSRRRRALRWAGIAFSLFVLWLAAWSLAGYFSFRDGVQAANERLPKAAERELSGQDGLLLSKATTILLMGTDSARNRPGLRHSDSMMLVRADPDVQRISYLSIPRDLWVEIPGYGSDRVNTAYQIGGAPLALRTVRSLTGLDLDHVVVVDFERFKELIDRIGGIEVTVPHAIQSNRFECPYDAARCASWDGWRFAKGRQHMDGRRALVYSRIRENRLDASDNDITRAERQQQVTQAILDKLAGVGTFLRLPFIGGDLLEPLATDLTAGELVQLGWVKLRASHTLRCRLGGDPATIGGAWVLQSSEENRNVLSMFTGDSAPQPPPPGTGTYGPGCVTGSKSLGSR